jgi:putative drug exporter of the RND superfamily
MYWMAPILAFPLIVGLGLDYDIFLFSRIYEFRKMGYAPTPAIVKGVAKTGEVITFAGIIMAIAFCGLMASSLRCLQEIGYVTALSAAIFFRFEPHSSLDRGDFSFR